MSNYNEEQLEVAIRRTESELENLRRRLKEARAPKDYKGFSYNDPYDDGVVLTTTRSYKTVRSWGYMRKEYHYAAIRANGLWFLTGKTTRGLSWREFIDWLTEPGTTFTYVKRLTDSVYIDPQPQM